MARRPGSANTGEPKRDRSTVPMANTRRADGTKICGARRKGGGLCQQSRMLMPNGRCRMHGGTALRGLLSKSVKDGRYAKDMPPRLQARFEEAMADQELLSLRRDVALLDSLLTEKMSELKDAEANPDLNVIMETVDAIAKGWKGWDYTRMDRELTALKGAIESRQNEAAILREVRELVKEKAVVISQESRRLIDLEQTMTVEQGMLLMQSLAGIIRRYVMPLEGGQRMMKQIAADFREVISIKDA